MTTTPNRTSEPASPPPAFGAGDVVGSYELVRPIHAGAFGQVWLGRHTLVPGDRRAVKVLRNDTLGAIELDGIRRYRSVADSQPGLVPVPEIGLVPGKGYYYTMPLADDVNGRAVVRDADEYEPMTLQRYGEIHRPAPIDRVLGVALHLLPALQALHEAGLVHRDIKPGNIVRIEGQWKMCDLGLLARRDEIAVNSGTPGFIPPEGVKDRRADVYAFGVTLYLLATGRRFSELPAFLEGRLQVPGTDDRRDPLREIICKACHPDPDKRYQTALDMHFDANRLVRTTKVTVVLDDHFATFTTSRLEEFVKAVRERGFHIHGIPVCVEGSVRITLELTAEDAEGLARAIKAGELARFRASRTEITLAPVAPRYPAARREVTAPGVPAITPKRPEPWRERAPARRDERELTRRPAGNRALWLFLVAGLSLVAGASVGAMLAGWWPGDHFPPQPASIKSVGPVRLQAGKTTEVRVSIDRGVGNKNTAFVLDVVVPNPEVIEVSGTGPLPSGDGTIDLPIAFKVKKGAVPRGDITFKLSGPNGEVSSWTVPVEAGR